MTSTTTWARRLAATSIFLATMAVAANVRAATKLWLAWDSSTVGCKQHTTDFFNCILNDTNFNQLALQYQNGEPLTVAGTATLSQYCNPTDFQCVVNVAGFHPTAYDVVMHFYGSGWGGGTNGTATVSVAGQNVFINTAWVQSGDNCDGQTCTGAHEAYEAATDGVSADCCNGQYGHPSCPQCQPSCAQYDGNNGHPPYGCYSLTCNGGTYSMELLGRASNEFSAAGCTALTPINQCGAMHAACTAQPDGGSGCCSGLSCELFSLSGQPPYNHACCLGLDKTCSANTDCCGGSNCVGGKCACVPDGQWCLNADECCAGSSCDTQAHKCVTNPPPDAGGAPDAGRADSDAGARSDAAPSSDAAGPHEAGVILDAAIGEDGMADSAGLVDPASAPPSSEGGCSCTMKGNSGPRFGLAALLPLAVAAAARRRRRRVSETTSAVFSESWAGCDGSRRDPARSPSSGRDNSLLRFGRTRLRRTLRTS